MAFITLPNGVQTYYERFGSGTPIVFIHPPGMGHVTFHYQRPLSRRYEILLYDLRGNGKSSTINEVVTIRALCDDLNFLLESLSINEVYICGYSNGGSIAQEFAITYPDKVKGVILIGGFSEVSTKLLRAEFFCGIKLTQLGGLPIIAKAISYAHATSKPFERQLFHYIMKADERTLYEMYIDGLHYVATDRLHKMNSPVLLIYGEKDYYVHEYQYPFLQSIEDVEVVYIANVKHQVPTLQATALNTVIDKFVQNHPFS